MNNNIRDFTTNKSGDTKRTEGSDRGNETFVGSGRTSATSSRDVAEAAATASARLEEYGISTDQMVDAALRKTSDIQDAFADAIRANPLRSVAIAAGIGYVYAMINR